MKNIKKNNLSLKSLQAELEQLKSRPLVEGYWGKTITREEKIPARDVSTANDRVLGKIKMFKICRKIPVRIWCCLTRVSSLFISVYLCLCLATPALR